MAPVSVAPSAVTDNTHKRASNERKRAAARWSASLASGSTEFESEHSGAPPGKKSRATNNTPIIASQSSSNDDDSNHMDEQQQQQSLLQFPAEVLLDLAGSTSAEVRRMNDDERALVHYKRRLRNRESAKRSRARRQATLGDIQAELEDLRQLTSSLVERCMRFAKRSERQSLELDTLRKEKQLLESLLRSNSGNCSL